MATIQHSQSTLADAAEARTTVPAAAPGAGRLEDTGHDHDDHGHDHEDHGHEDHDHAFEWPEIVRIAVVAVAAVAVWFRVWEPIPAVSVIGVAGLLLAGALGQPHLAVHALAIRLCPAPRPTATPCLATGALVGAAAREEDRSSSLPQAASPPAAR